MLGRLVVGMSTFSTTGNPTRNSPIVDAVTPVRDNGGRARAERQHIERGPLEGGTQLERVQRDERRDPRHRVDGEHVADLRSDVERNRRERNEQRGPDEPLCSERDRDVRPRLRAELHEQRRLGGLRRGRRWLAWRSLVVRRSRVPDHQPRALRVASVVVFARVEQRGEQQRRSNLLPSCHRTIVARSERQEKTRPMSPLKRRQLASSLKVSGEPTQYRL